MRIRRLSPAQAVVEANRCYFCHDAPCVEACPTGIDIPSFIRKIATGNLRGSAQTILEANILGRKLRPRLPHRGIVRARLRAHGAGDTNRSQIGALQRHATDWLMDRERSHRSFARRADRAADRGGGRRTGGSRLRAWSGAARPRRHDLRSAAEARRAERIRHRRL